MTNGYDETTVKRFVAELERANDELATLKGEHMARCKTVQDRKKEILDRAVDSGLPRKILKRLVESRALEAKVKNLRDDLEDDDAESFDRMREALGGLADLPLGQAAMAKPAKVVGFPNAPEPH